MSKPDAAEIVLIAAVARNGVIGADGAMPWHLPADLRRFKALTTGHPVVMGRRTFESIGRPLPGRTTIVLTRDTAFETPGCVVVSSLDAALAAARYSPGGDQVWVIGGGTLYQEALAHADRLEITCVDAEVDGDTWFPDIDPSVWTCTASERHEADTEHEVGFEFRTCLPADESSADAATGD